MTELKDADTEDDDAYDETEGEKEAPMRETDDTTQLLEEMEYDDEDDLPHLEDDDADEEDNACRIPRLPLC